MKSKSSRRNQADLFFGEPFADAASADLPKADPPSAAEPSLALPQKFTVTQLTRLIKLILSDKLPGTLFVEGEISNFKRHSSGHLYFTLKDENAQLPAVMWKTAASPLKFKLQDGMAVLACGYIDVYEPQGKYQFYAEKLEPAGLGALELAKRQLEEKLRKEGLFDESRKKSIPRFPFTIAIITSDTGAAIEDILNTLHRRFPIVRKLLCPVPVQGETAAGQIASAIRDINRRRHALGGVDLLIVARGGGSIEDLWAFNEEVVARAIAASDIPVITGIGHEIDTTIADLAADRRAATPTAAAELAVPVLADLIEMIHEYHRQLRVDMQSILRAAKTDWQALFRRPFFHRPLDPVRHRQQILDERYETCRRQISELFRSTEKQLQQFASILRRIEPHMAVTRAEARLQRVMLTLRTAWQQSFQNRVHRKNRIWLSLQTIRPIRRIQEQNQNLRRIFLTLIKSQKQRFQHAGTQSLHLHQRLQNLNPRAVLARGFTLTRLKSSGRILHSSSAIQAGDILQTEFADRAQIESQVLDDSGPRKEMP